MMAIYILINITFIAICIKYDILMFCQLHRSNGEGGGWQEMMIEIKGKLL